MSVRLELPRRHDEQSDEDWGCWRVPRVDTTADTIPAPAFVLVRQCPCGVRYDEEGWAKLHVVGEQDDGAGGTFELRNCALCHFSISRGDDKRRTA